jgi:YVTN family beta-propeller protein
LFTDIVDSTKVAAELGDRRWRELLARHHHILRRELKQHRGKEIDTAGDGFFAAFQEPGAAIRCAFSAGRAIADLGIDLRAGVHVGELEPMGEKPGGIAVHTGARILAEAGPREILVSLTTKELVAGSGIEFADRGMRHLRGVPEDVHLFAVLRIDGEPMPPALPTDTAAERRARIPAASLPSALKGRRAVLIGAGVFILGVALVASIVVLARGGSGTLHPSLVPPNNVGRIDAATTELVAEIPTTGTAPSAVVWGEGSLWIANTISRTVAKVDPETNSVIQTVPTGGAPIDLATGEGVVWVLNGFDGTVLAIDPRTNQVSTTTSVPVGSAEIAIGAGAVWVTNSLDASVTKVDTETREAVGTIRLGTWTPRAIAVDGDLLWVGDGLKPVLLQIDGQAGEIMARIGLRAPPTEIAVGMDGTVWVTSYDANLVSVVDPDTLQVSTVEVGVGPVGVVVGEGGVWVAESGDGTISRIQIGSNRVVDTIRIGRIPEGVALGRGSVWVSVHA